MPLSTNPCKGLKIDSVSPPMSNANIKNLILKRILQMNILTKRQKDVFHNCRVPALALISTDDKN